MTVVNPTSDNTALWSAMLNAFANAHGAGGIVSGCSISKGTGDWDIDVTAGTIIEANTEAPITADTVTITDASGLSSGESRVTLIHADTGDAIASTDGSAAADPASPDIPASEVLLGFVVVAEGDSTVADSDIFDIPSLVQNMNAIYKDGGSHELDAADLAGGDGTGGQFLQTDGSAASWADIGFASERGTYSVTNSGTQSVSLNNTYDPDAFVASVSGEIRTGGDNLNIGHYISAYNTDGNGDITGFDVTYNVDSSGAHTAGWTAMGVTV